MSIVEDDDLARLRAIVRRMKRAREDRDEEIEALVAREVPRERIAQTAGLTREQVRRIANAVRKRREGRSVG